MQSGDRERYQTNLQAEIDGAALYRALAEIEAGCELATVYSAHGRCGGAARRDLAGQAP